MLQCFIALHGPGAEPFEQTVLHLARGGLGIGQAQDVLGQNAFKQQARDPVR